jgi:transposase
MKRFNSGFAKTATLDFSWSEFVRMIEYKMAWIGKHLVLVDRFFPSSKTCSSCGFIKHDLTLDERTWVCPSCNSTHDRDVNAAKNLKREGIRILLSERKFKINASTVGTTGSNASGDRARPVIPMATVGEGRIHAL